jgi:hypothetical protein
MRAGLPDKERGVKDKKSKIGWERIMKAETHGFGSETEQTKHEVRIATTPPSYS